MNNRSINSNTNNNINSISNNNNNNINNNANRSIDNYSNFVVSRSVSIIDDDHNSINKKNKNNCKNDYQLNDTRINASSSVSVDYRKNNNDNLIAVNTINS